MDNKITNGIKSGDVVIYVPRHANGRLTHPDCEVGKVSTVRAGLVYVKYGEQEVAKMTPVCMLRKKPKAGVV